MLSSLLQFFGWTWVGVLSSDDDSGIEETQILTQYLAIKGICIAYMIKIRFVVLSGVNEIVKNNIETIRRSSAQVIILCGTFSSFMADFLAEVSHVLHDKTLIFGPIFASKQFLVEHHRKVLEGSLAVEFFDLPVPDMKHFYDSFHPGDRLPGHIWLVNLHCTTNDPRNKIYMNVYKSPLLQNCSGTERISDFSSFQSPGLTDRVYEAVYSLARALHNMYLSPVKKSQDKMTQAHNYPHQVSNYFNT